MATAAPTNAQEEEPPNAAGHEERERVRPAGTRPGASQRLAGAMGALGPQADVWGLGLAQVHRIKIGIFVVLRRTRQAGAYHLGGSAPDLGSDLGHGRLQDLPWVGESMSSCSLLGKSLR